MSKVSKLGPLLCAVFGCGSFFGAKYQFGQKKEKEKFIKRINERLSSEAVECPSKLSQDEIDSAYKYQRVSVRGVIDNNNTIIMGPRPPPSSTPHYKISNPNSWGGYVYSPLRTESGQTIIVNRGWIPKHELPQNDNDTFVCKKRLGDDYRIYEGIISPESPPFFENENKKKKNDDIESTVWQFRDKGYSNRNQKEFVVVDILSPQNEYGEYPHRLTQTDVLGMIHIPPQQHMIYACSLFTTGAVLLGFSYYLIKRPSKITSMNAAVLCGLSCYLNKRPSNFI